MGESKRGGLASALASSLPLDIAPNARLLVGCGRSAGGDGFDSQPEVAARNTLTVSGSAIVELPPVSELSAAVEGVKIWRAGRVERAGYSLRLVE